MNNPRHALGVGYNYDDSSSIRLSFDAIAVERQSNSRRIEVES